MPKSKHRKKHKYSLSQSKQPGGVLAQIVDSMMAVAPIPPLHKVNGKMK